MENHPFLKEDSSKNAVSWGPKCGIIETNGGRRTFFAEMQRAKIFTRIPSIGRAGCPFRTLMLAKK